MVSSRNVRILLGKLGVDLHDRGVTVLAQKFRESGFEVIYTGRYQTPEMIASAAVQEDADVVGLSFHDSGHLFFTPLVVDHLRKKGAGNYLLVVGGSIPKDHIPQLKEMGVDEVFRAGTRVEDIIRFIEEKVAPQKGQQKEG